jgi:hypothetical protein
MVTLEKCRFQDGVGHEKGAFTGAQYRQKGKFEIAELDSNRALR